MPSINIAQIAFTHIQFAQVIDRFHFIEWTRKAFRNVDVIPPGNGIMHQINLEKMSPVVYVQDGVAFPDPAKAAFTAMAESVMAAGMEAVVDVAVLAEHLRAMRAGARAYLLNRQPQRAQDWLVRYVKMGQAGDLQADSILNRMSGSPRFQRILRYAEENRQPLGRVPPGVVHHQQAIGAGLPLLVGTVIPGSTVKPSSTSSSAASSSAGASGSSVCSSPITSSLTQFDRPTSRPSRAVRIASSAV